MTKETKIGLLVGLAFIILFAIILSEKSGTSRDGTLPAFAMADSARKVGPPTGTEQPLHDAGKLPVEQKLNPPIDIRPSPPKTGSVESPSVSPESPHPLNTTESLADLLNPPEPPSRESPADHKEAMTVPLGEAVASALESGQTAVAPKSDKSSDTAPPSAQPGPESGTKDEIVDATAGETRPSAEPPVIKTTHEVQPGESLGKIAAKYYGRSNPQRVEAIFNANKDVLANANSVKAKTKLKIPDLGENSDKFEAAPGFVAAQVGKERKTGGDELVRIPPPIGDREQPSEKQREPALAERAALAANPKAAKDKTVADRSKSSKAVDEPGFQWYEVQQKDTLAKIAAKKLGDQKLYLEILRLNQDRITNKDLLKPGTKIRLPSKGKDAAALPETMSASVADAGDQ